MKVALLIVVAVCAFSSANAAKGGPLASLCSACKGGGGGPPPPAPPPTLFRDRFNMDHLLTKFDSDTEEDHVNPNNIIKKLQAIVNAVRETVEDILKEFVIPAVMSQVCRVCDFIQKIPPLPTLPPLPTALPPLPTLPPFPTNLPTLLPKGIPQLPLPTVEAPTVEAPTQEDPTVEDPTVGAPGIWF